MVSLRARAAVCWATAMTMTACHPNLRETLTADGLASSYGYAVRYRAGGELMPASWRPDSPLRPGGDAVTRYSFESDSAGAGVTTLGEYAYALRFHQRAGSGVVWLRDVPISARLGGRELGALVEALAAAMTGADDETALPEASAASAAGRRPGVISARGPVMLAGLAGYAVTLDFAGDPAAAGAAVQPRRVELVVVRAPGSYMQLPPLAKRPPRRFPVLLVAGYANAPADFDAALPDFHELLARVTIAGRAGFTTAPVE